MKKNIPMSDVTTDAAEYTLEANGFQNVLDAIRDCGGVEPTIKAFALALNIPVTRLNNIAKRPIAGQVWDPEFINWDALNEFFILKLKDDKVEYTNMVDLVVAAQQKDEYLKQAGTRHTGISTGANLIDVDGGKMPARKAKMFEMGSEAESLLCFKKDAGVYRIVYQTLGYTAIRQVNADGEFCAELVRVLSNGTLNTKCVPPTEMAKAIEERFSGEYQARHINDKDVIAMEHPVEEATVECDAASADVEG